MHGRMAVLPLFGQETFYCSLLMGSYHNDKCASTARTMISGQVPVLTGAWKFFRGRGRVRG